MERAAGILMPIFSLPSKYGIGSFSKEAYEFIDVLKRTHQKFWQVLPLGMTGYGDSPYQSFSSFAGNYYFIDLDELIDEGLLDGNEEELFILDEAKEFISYENQYKYKRLLLKKAFRKFNKTDDYERFCIDNDFWINEYSLYMVFKDRYKCDFFNFPEKYKKIDKELLEEIILDNIDDVEEHKFIQYIFFRQWKKLKKYANDNGIKIIGDIPIYVSMDSAEVWLYKDELMDFRDEVPVMVAGCPPDAFTEDGQLWGNPIYDWEKMKETNYSWWCKRFEIALKMYDYIRIDHFRGFDSYYCIPYGAENAKKGTWKEGPGIEFFEIIKNYLSSLNIDMNIIAEDLGILTERVKELLHETGFPGMKVTQFAFSDRNSDYLNYNHIKNAVVYTGTHDNDTIVAWIDKISKEEENFLRNYINVFDRKISNWDIIRLVMSSVCNVAIIPLSDYLGLGNEARINEPGTVGNNWKWRYKKGMLTEDIEDGIRYYTDLYGRFFENDLPV